ncbi:MAG: hypothetical protein ACE5F9_01350 [Phycisphaerae bacterium]
MRPKSRFLPIAKWSGSVLCLLIAGVWGVSTSVPFYCTGHVRGVACTVKCTDGSSHLFWTHPAPGTNIPKMPAWSIKRIPAPSGVHVWMPQMRRLVLPRGPVGELVILPFWIPLAIVAIPTAILWRRDRRRIPPRHCRSCGYDLRASRKRCPECGTPFAQQQGRLPKSR